MNFTSDIKKELIANGIEKEGGKSAISAFLMTSGDVGLKDGEPIFYFVSETENVAEFFMSAFFEAFGAELYVSHATRDKMRGRDKLVIQCPEDISLIAAKGLGLIKKTGDLRDGIARALISSQEGQIAYIKGAFLGGGSCTLPSEGGKTGYHLEFIFPSKKLAQDFCRLLAEFELLAKVAERKESYVVYMKSKELISDFLSIVGAENNLKKFSLLVEKRDRANNDNRALNCMAGNADKTARAAVKQVFAIEKLRGWSGFNDLSEELRVLAIERVNYPTLSLQELAVKLSISKSCLNHRMRKILELAEKLN